MALPPAPLRSSRALAAMTRIPITLALATLAAAALAAFALALGVGSVALDPVTVLRALAGSGDATPRAIVQELRLPRALAAFATGGSLAMAGALLQVLLRNPLADPYVLGVSGGAAVGALAAMLLGAVAWLIPAGAFAGAFASTVLVFALARGSGAWSPTRLLLTGVIVAAGWGAMVALLLSLAPDAQLRGMLFWLIGDLSAPPAAWTPLLVLVLALIVMLPFARDLNALARGDAVAAALGVSITPPAVADLRAGRVADRGRRDHGRGDRLRRADRAARGPAGAGQRPARAAAGVCARRRRDALDRRYAGATARRTGAAAGRRRHRADRRASVPDPAAARTMSAAPLLRVGGLTVRIAALTVCRNLSLAVAPGQCWAILGPNGAGKTTLLHDAGGPAPAAAGTIELAGLPLGQLSPRDIARRRAVLPQDDSDAFAATVLETALVGRHPHLSRWQWEGAEDLAIARAALAAMDIGEARSA